LHLPIQKKLITRFLVIKSIFNPYNLIAPAIFIPLTISTFIPALGIEKSMTWLIFTLLVSLCLHFFNLLMKKKLEDNLTVWLIFAILIALNFVGDRFMDFELIH